MVICAHREESLPYISWPYIICTLCISYFTILYYVITNIWRGTIVAHHQSIMWTTHATYFRVLLMSTHLSNASNILIVIVDMPSVMNSWPCSPHTSGTSEYGPIPLDLELGTIYAAICLTSDRAIQCLRCWLPQVGALGFCLRESKVQDCLPPPPNNPISTTPPLPPRIEAA